MALEYHARTFSRANVQGRRAVLVCATSARDYSAEFAEAKEAAVMHAVMSGITIHSITIKSSGLWEARDYCLTHLRTEEWGDNNPEFVLFLDADTIFPMDLISTLVEAAERTDADIVGVLSTSRHIPFRPRLLNTSGRPYELEDIKRFENAGEAIEVGAVGFECALLRSRIVDRFERPYFTSYYRIEHVLNKLNELQSVAERRSIAGEEIKELRNLLKHHFVSEDFSFCLRAREKGGRVVCDFGLHTDSPEGSVPGVARIRTRICSFHDTLKYSN